MKTIISIALLSLINVSPALAQGHVGGGRIQESDLRYFIGMMDPFFASEEGKALFPEIVAYDKAHQPEASFHDLINRIHPVVIEGPVHDSFNDDRDCIAEINDARDDKEQKPIYFECNGMALPEMKLENHPSLYRIVLHELFVAAGIEKPISKAIPSDYSVSFRITTNVHLETYTAYVPGKGKPERVNYIRNATEYQCVFDRFTINDPDPKYAFKELGVKILPLDNEKGEALAVIGNFTARNRDDSGIISRGSFKRLKGENNNGHPSVYAGDTDASHEEIYFTTGRNSAGKRWVAGIKMISKDQRDRPNEVILQGTGTCIAEQSQVIKRVEE